LTEDHIREIPQNGGPLLTDQEHTTLLFAELLITSPDGITDTLFAELRRFFTDGQIVELMFYVLTMNIGARFNSAIDLDPSTPGEIVVI
jgi:alkylhydroperoxidase family enzyme